MNAMSNWIKAPAGLRPTVIHMTGPELLAIRKDAGLSAARFAGLVRIANPQDIYQMERGKRPISGPVSLLAELLRDGHLRHLTEEPWPDRD